MDALLIVSAAQPGMGAAARPPAHDPGAQASAFTAFLGAVDDAPFVDGVPPGVLAPPALAAAPGAKPQPTRLGPQLGRAAPGPDRFEGVGHGTASAALAAPFAVPRSAPVAQGAPEKGMDVMPALPPDPPAPQSKAPHAEGSGKAEAAQRPQPLPVGDVDPMGGQGMDAARSAPAGPLDDALVRAGGKPRHAKADPPLFAAMASFPVPSIEVPMQVDGNRPIAPSMAVTAPLEAAAQSPASPPLAGAATELPTNAPDPVLRTPDPARSIPAPVILQPEVQPPATPVSGNRMGPIPINPVPPPFAGSAMLTGPLIADPFGPVPPIAPAIERGAATEFGAKPVVVPGLGAAMPASDPPITDPRLIAAGKAPDHAPPRIEEGRREIAAGILPGKATAGGPPPLGPLPASPLFDPPGPVSAASPPAAQPGKSAVAAGITPRLPEQRPAPMTLAANAVPDARPMLPPPPEGQANAVVPVKPTQAGTPPISMPAGTPSPQPVKTPAIGVTLPVLVPLEPVLGAAALSPPSPIAGPDRPIPPELPPPAARQIVVALSSLPREAGAGVDIALDPPELGRVRLNLVEVNGALSLSIIAERPETVDLMRRHLVLLADEFARFGLDAPSVDISGERGRRQTAQATPPMGTGDKMPEGGVALGPTLPTPRSAPADGLDLRL